MTATVNSRSQQTTDTHRRILQCGGKSLDLSRPRVMGVLNITPDSFSDGGCLHKDGRPCVENALRRVEQMLDEGADIIDIGGESTRPGAAPVSVQEEMDRVLPMVEAVNQRFDTIISVDTSTAQLMQAAADCGAGLLNDVRALEKNAAVQAAVDTGLPVCLMHMRGQPQTMQDSPQYYDVVKEVSDYISERVSECIKQGLQQNNIVVDPGFGFGKSPEHNLILLNRLADIAALGYPVLVGLSRKSLIGHVLGRPVDKRLAGSLALATLAVSRGASIIRVHDVEQTVDAVRMCDAVIKQTS